MNEEIKDTVLVIMHRKRHLSLLCGNVQHRGWKAVGVKTIKGASSMLGIGVEVSTSIPVDAILIDLDLPGDSMNDFPEGKGPQFIEKVRGNVSTRNLPIVIITMLAHIKKYKRFAKEQKCKLYPKPLDMDSLMLVLRRQLKRARRRKDGLSRNR